MYFGMEAYLVTLLDSLIYTIVDLYIDHGTDGLHDLLLDSVMYGLLHIEDGITQFVIHGIDLIEIISEEPMHKLVENIDLIEIEELPFTEMIDV